MTTPRVLDSHNSPLQIGRIAVGHGLAEIGFTLCPGKQQSRSVSGIWQRDLAVDLDAVQAWGAAAVVTLMPWSELRAVHCEGIGAACEARGMQWHHLPICDVDVPDAAFEDAWCYAGLRLREHLRQGRSVLVHCRGGLGRSGLVAARLLVELGWPAARAVAAVRAQRPGAIETAAQERHVLKATAITAADDAYAARVLGCVLGGAVGDGFGYAIEFDRWADIQRKHGKAGLQQPVLSGGALVVSDDTQMTLFTLEALHALLPGQGHDGVPLSLPPFVQACRQAYLRWGETQGVRGPGLDEAAARAAPLFRSPALRQRRAPGNTCLSAVRAGALGGVDNPINSSKGCGAVMRTAPIGLLRGLSAQQALQWGSAAGALTHGHVDGWLPSGAMAGLVRLLLEGDTLEQAVRQMLALCNGTCSAGSGAENDTCRLLEQALRLAASGTPAAAAHLCLGEGWTGDEALAIAVHAVALGDSFENAVRLAANHSGDSDSTASIAGQLYGARDGILAVPHAWVRPLDVLPDALALVRGFLALQRVPQRSSSSA